VLIFGDAITRSWKQVIQFRPEAPPRPAERRRTPREPVAVSAPPMPSLAEDSRREFVRDVRGVWLPREADD
jgi:cyanophycin synthetase